MSAVHPVPAPAPRPREAEDPPREMRDVTLRPLLAIAAVFVVLAIAGHFGLAAFQRSLERGEHRADARAARSALPALPPPAPRLQTDPAAELAAWRAIEARDLERLEWVDRSRGIVRIPIERAMAVLAARGLPARAAVAGESTGVAESTGVTESTNAAEGGSR